MITIRLLLCLVVFALIPILGQSTNAQSTKNSKKSQNEKLDSQKPSVYISFEKVGTREPIGDGSNSDKVFLRLHNNTRWTISFCVNGFFDREGRESTFKNAIETSLNYEVERERDYSRGMAFGTKEEALESKPEIPPLPRGNPTIHGCSLYRLISNKSVIFSVNSQDLADGLKIKVNFGFDWDSTTGMTGTKTAYYVYFSSRGLPR